MKGRLRLLREVQNDPAAAVSASREAAHRKTAFTQMTMDIFIMRMGSLYGKRFGVFDEVDNCYYYRAYGTAICM